MSTDSSDCDLPRGKNIFTLIREEKTSTFFPPDWINVTFYVPIIIQIKVIEVILQNNFSITLFKFCSM